MKKGNILFSAFIVISLIMLPGCGGSGSDDSPSNAGARSVKVDNTTTLETGYQGLAVDNVYIVNENDERVSGTDVALNTNFSIVYEGVKNYTLKNGKAFPDLSILVSDPNKNPVLNKTDLLASYADGLSEEDASFLRAIVTVGDPIKPGKYTCSVQIVDKNNKESSIVSTWEFNVK